MIPQDITCSINPDTHHVKQQLNHQTLQFEEKNTFCILLNIMFHAPMERFQLELIYSIYFSIVVPSNICVSLSCRPFVVNTTFSTGLVGVENILTTKCLQERNTNVGWDDGGKIGKIIN